MLRGVDGLGVGAASNAGKAGSSRRQDEVTVTALADGEVDVASGQRSSHYGGLFHKAVAALSPVEAHLRTH